MKEFEGILIISDFDGTIACDGKVSSENREAIRHFTENGGRFSLCSGRALAFTSEIARSIGCNTLIGCYNGAVCYDFRQDHILYTTGFDVKAADVFRTLAEHFPNHERITIDNAEKKWDFSDTASAADAVSNIAGPVYKMVFFQQPDATYKMADVFSDYPDFDVYLSNDFMFEVMPKGVNKGTFLQKMRRMLAPRVHMIIAIGDYNNDIPMISAADVGVAVQGGHPDAIAAAQIVAPTLDRHTIVWLVDQLERKQICK